MRSRVVGCRGPTSQDHCSAWSSHPLPPSHSWPRPLEAWMTRNTDYGHSTELRGGLHARMIVVQYLRGVANRSEGNRLLRQVFELLVRSEGAIGFGFRQILDASASRRARTVPHTTGSEADPGWATGLPAILGCATGPRPVPCAPNRGRPHWPAAGNDCEIRRRSFGIVATVRH